MILGVFADSSVSPSREKPSLKVNCMSQSAPLRAAFRADSRSLATNMPFAAQCIAPACAPARARAATRKSRAVRASAHQPGVIMPDGDASDLNKWSRKITQPKSQGASQAMLYATGLTEADMNKPQVRASEAKRMREDARRRLD